MVQKIRPINKLAGWVFAIHWAGLHAFGLDPIVILQPSDAEKGYANDFGMGVAISRDWLVIGAPGDHELEVDAGAAYVFRRAGAAWIEHQKLYGLGEWNERFGAWAALDDDWLIIGSPRTSTHCCSTGRLFVFRRDLKGSKSDLTDDSWELFQVINQDLALCCMGASFAVEDGTLVVGAGGPEFNPDTESGKIYIFEWNGNTWAGPQTITPSDPMPQDGFGRSVTISGSSIAVGASYAGAVYIFRRTHDGWAEDVKLSLLGERFGSSVRMDGSILLVGAPGRDGQRIDEGAAYLFKEENGTWVQKHQLLAWDSGGQYPGFGNSVAIRNNLVVVGVEDQPWAYAFKLEEENCTSLDSLQQSEGSSSFVRTVTDGRIVMVRDHLYAVGNFDLSDFARLQRCADAAQRPLEPECTALDLEEDGAVDAADVPLFLLTFRGPP